MSKRAIHATLVQTLRHWSVDSRKPVQDGPGPAAAPPFSERTDASKVYGVAWKLSRLKSELARHLVQKPSEWSRVPDPGAPEVPGESSESRR